MGFFELKKRKVVFQKKEQPLKKAIGKSAPTFIAFLIFKKKEKRRFIHESKNAKRLIGERFLIMLKGLNPCAFRQSKRSELFSPAANRLQKMHLEQALFSLLFFLEKNERIQFQKFFSLDFFIKKKRLFDFYMNRPKGSTFYVEILAVKTVLR